MTSIIDVQIHTLLDDGYGKIITEWRYVHSVISFYALSLFHDRTSVSNLTAHTCAVWRDDDFVSS